MTREEIEAEIIRLYLADEMTTTEIAAHLGLASKNVVIGIVGRWRARTGETAKKRGRNTVEPVMSEADLARYHVRHATGETWERIAASADLPPKVLAARVQRYRERVGIVVRAEPRPAPERVRARIRPGVAPVALPGPEKPVEAVLALEPVIAAPAPVRLPGAAVDIIAATQMQCLWAVSDEPRLFCGEPVCRPGVRWCAEHYRIAYRKAEKYDDVLPYWLARKMRAA